jgi:hypothetical protein
MRAVFRHHGAMRTRCCRRRLSLSPVSISSQREQQESNEFEQNSGRRGNGLGPGLRTQEGLDLRTRGGVTHIRVSVHRVASGTGSAITIRQRWEFELHRGSFSRS